MRTLRKSMNISVVNTRTKAYKPTRALPSCCEIHYQPRLCLPRLLITCSHKTGDANHDMKCCLTSGSGLVRLDSLKWHDLTLQYRSSLDCLQQWQSFVQTKSLPAPTKLWAPVLSTRTICSQWPSILEWREDRPRSHQCESSGITGDGWRKTYPVFSYNTFTTVHGVTNKTGVPVEKIMTLLHRSSVLRCAHRKISTQLHHVIIYVPLSISLPNFILFGHKLWLTLALSLKKIW